MFFTSSGTPFLVSSIIIFVFPLLDLSFRSDTSWSCFLFRKFAIDFFSWRLFIRKGISVIIKDFLSVLFV
jgi:hypothetical protein